MENEVYDEEPDEKTQEVNDEEQKKAAAERKRQKKLEQLDRKIKRLSKKHDNEKGIIRVASEIRNKQKRQEIVIRKRMAGREEKLIEKLKKKKVREEQGEEAMPRGITRTIESMRVADETLIENNDDEEIKGEQDMDEFSSYFKN